MAEKIRLELVTPTKQLLSVDVDSISMVGTEGDFSVLPNHTPMLTTLEMGELSYQVNGETHFVFVDWGFCEVLPDKVIILAETSELAFDIDVEEAKRLRAEAQAILDQKRAEDDVIFEQARVELLKQIARLGVASKIRM
ncbi:F0F1 ATP synthase subunit epsilon [Desulfurispirillum indicum]|uniref:ATP synthase epsilon chain n=1 Tax=Desulfurispirillum indicum (strain ATCC BAA-1389 / DSM 22839 / S5) TaxID=653733 RepID=E6W3T9_DESIS|nr:F0F1 ATP synthase subunit epsilon [Desulfurispirillum indicum]ADU66970.1 ATP synthase F1, epsilon subunit [Desulfurispirillum indicum S5]UCZ56323.1 F0F1 ATP synthase subunit epsilon [Desulfurispirillum indicum]